MAQKPRKRARKRKLKQPLSLTINPVIRAKAQQIARREHRSVSSLFEYLIAAEWRKHKQELADPGLT